jgi:hypothetical protein
MKNKFLIAGLVIAAAVFTGCQKDPLKNLTAGESRIYITNRDSSVSFSNFKTFSIADSVGVIEDNRGMGKALEPFDAAVIAKVKASLTARGFQEVDRTASPDLGVTVSRIYNNYTGLINYSDYWGNYGGYYDPFYWGYGGYSYYDPTYYGPDYYGTYQVTQGALSVDILNLKDAKQENSIHPVWSAISRGTGVFSSSNIDTQVNALFEQSPYLVTNQ